MNLELRHLDLVRAVVEEGGLTRAGKRLGLSQSALSHQLHGIEERFGVSLFHRVGKRLALAPAGERMLQTARLVFPEIERTERDLRQNSNQMVGTIRVSTECYTCYHWLPGILHQFRRRYPMVDLRIVALETRKPILALLNNELDVGIIYHPTRDRRVKMTELFDDELVAVIAAGHPLADREYLRPKDFSTENLFSYTSLATNFLYLKVLRPAGICPKEVSEIPLTEAILELIKAGFGIAALARGPSNPILHVANFAQSPSPPAASAVNGTPRPETPESAWIL